MPTRKSMPTRRTESPAVVGFLTLVIGDQHDPGDKGQDQIDHRIFLTPRQRAGFAQNFAGFAERVIAT